MYLAPAVCTSTLYSLLFVTITSGYLLLFNYCILKGLCHKLAISQGLNVFFYCKVSIALFELFGNLTVSYVCVSYSRCDHLIYVFWLCLFAVREARKTFVSVCLLFAIEFYR